MVTQFLSVLQFLPAKEPCFHHPAFYAAIFCSLYFSPEYVFRHKLLPTFSFLDLVPNISRCISHSTFALGPFFPKFVFLFCHNLRRLNPGAKHVI